MLPSKLRPLCPLSVTAETPPVIAPVFEPTESAAVPSSNVHLETRPEGRAGEGDGDGVEAGLTEGVGEGLGDGVVVGVGVGVGLAVGEGDGDGVGVGLGVKSVTSIPA